MGQKVEYKTIDFDFKKVTEEGDFEGYLSVFGNVDSGGDKVWPGAYKKTLKDPRTGGQKTFVLLYGHNTFMPIGDFTGKEDSYGLFTKGGVNLMLTPSGYPKIPKAHEAHAFMIKGTIKGLSIGYDPLKWDIEEDKKKGRIRNLREIRLWEGSLVPFAMNELAEITNAKADDIEWVKLKNKINEMIVNGFVTKEQILDMFKEPEATSTQNNEPSAVDIHRQKILKGLLEIFERR